MSSDKTMAVVAMPITTSLHATAQNPFARLHYGPLGRRGSSDIALSTPLGPRSVSSGCSTANQRQLTSLEDLAAQLEERVDEVYCPSAAFTYLDGKDHGDEDNSFTFFPTRSRSLPSNYFTSCSAKSAISSKPLLRKTKSVRFADTQGLPLVDVVHQLTFKDSSYTANKIVPYEDEDLLNRCPLILSGLQSIDQKCTTLEEQSNGDASKSPKKFVLRQNPPSSNYFAHKHTFTFTQPSLEPDFLDRVKMDYVVLESIREEPRSLHGIVRVSNLSYEKDVYIRWTHDHWRTSHDTCSVFCSNDGSTDRFAFELPINGDDVSFAIRFRTQGIEYWDNNYGRNYTVLSGP